MKPNEPGEADAFLQKKNILDQAEDFIWAVDIDYRLVFGNASFQNHSIKIIGREVIPGDSALPPDLDSEVAVVLKEYYRRALQNGERFIVEIKSKYLPGNPFIEYSFDPIQQLEGRITGVVVVGRNVTDRRKAEDLHARTRDLLFFTQQLTATGSWEWDIRTQEMFWTPEVYRIHDIEPSNDRTLGKEILEVSLSCYPSDARGRVLATFERCCSEAIPYDLESAFVSCQGHHKWIRTMGHPIVEDGVVVRVVGHIQDLTISMNQKLKLSDSELRYRTLVEQAADMFFLHDLEGRIHDVNHAAMSNTGYSREELLDMSVFDLDPDLFEKCDPNVIWRPLSPGDECVFETRHRRKDGSFYTAEVKVGKIILNEKEYILALSRDISQRKQTEEALLNSERRANAILEAIPDMLFRINEKGVLLDYRAPKDGLYFQGESIIGRNICDIMPESFVIIALGKIDEVIQTGLMQEFEYTLLIPEKGERIFDARMVLYARDEVIVIVRDVSEWKHSKQIIVEQNRQLEKAMDDKRRIFSIIAHDLRNPFGVFMGFAEILHNTGDQMSRDELRTIHDKMNGLAKNMYEMLDNLLEWSIVKGRQRILTLDTLDLKELITRCMFLYFDLAENKTLTLENNVPAHLMAKLNKQSLETVVRNLISNAIKFTKAGGKISIHAKERSDDMLEITVSDTGIGMDQEILAQLSSHFGCFNRTGTQGELSNGLGLFLCKELLDEMGASLNVYSELEKGTTVSIVLPKA